MSESEEQKVVEVQLEPANSQEVIQVAVQAKQQETEAQEG